VRVQQCPREVRRTIERKGSAGDRGLDIFCCRATRIVYHSNSWAVIRRPCCGEADYALAANHILRRPRPHGMRTTHRTCCVRPEGSLLAATTARCRQSAFHPGFLHMRRCLPREARTRVCQSGCLITKPGRIWPYGKAQIKCQARMDAILHQYPSLHNASNFFLSLFVSRTTPWALPGTTTSAVYVTPGESRHLGLFEPPLSLSNLSAVPETLLSW
jgi:hypothetical protein